jgi:hypothetical protein
MSYLRTHEIQDTCQQDPQEEMQFTLPFPFKPLLYSKQRPKKGVTKHLIERLRQAAIGPCGTENKKGKNQELNFKFIKCRR